MGRDARRNARCFRQFGRLAARCDSLTLFPVEAVWKRVQAFISLDAGNAKVPCSPIERVEQTHVVCIPGPAARRRPGPSPAWWRRNRSRYIPQRKRRLRVVELGAFDDQRSNAPRSEKNPTTSPMIEIAKAVRADPRAFRSSSLKPRHGCHGGAQFAVNQRQANPRMGFFKLSRGAPQTRLRGETLTG